MSTKHISNVKIPSFTKRLSLSNTIKKNFSEKNIDYTQMGSMTPRFVNIYSKYMKSKQKTIYPNIMSILNDYRDEKLKRITEQEAMRGEIGEEIKKYKNLHDMVKRRRLAIDREKKYMSFSNKNKKKLKESKDIVIDIFYQYDNNLKNKRNKNNKEKTINNLISPFKIFKKNKNCFFETVKNKNKSSFYINKNQMIQLLDYTRIKKPKEKQGKKLKIKDCWNYCHNKINSYCDNITDESMKVIISGRKTMDKFNNTWNKYKLIQEFKFPELKKDVLEI